MTPPRGTVVGALLLGLGLTRGAAVHAQDRRAFDAGDPSTYPAGTTGCVSACTSGTIVLALPPDGVLRFSRVVVDGAFTVVVRGGGAPAVLDVTGDVLLRAPACCGRLTVAGAAGGAGTANGPGIGGAGGAGGYAGGRGHGQPITEFTPGENGKGPGGGVGATTTIQAIGGMFVDMPAGTPLAGGSGGGGGSGFEAASRCTGGGGGGGGGALTIVAGGRVALENVEIVADGGDGGEPGDRACAQGGAGGSGGAIHVIATRLEATGTARISARGGAPAFRAEGGTAGRIRLTARDGSAAPGLLTVPLAERRSGEGAAR